MHRLAIALSVGPLLGSVIAAPAVANGAQPDRPIKGALEGASISTPTFVDPDRVAEFCDPGTFALVESHANGTVSHLGRSTTAVFRHCHVEVQPPVVSDDRLVLYEVVRGALTFVAANGDHLSGTYTGTLAFFFEDESFRAPLSLTITGGTGRFSDATGILDMMVLVTPTGATEVVDIDIDLRGPISY